MLKFKDILFEISLYNNCISGVEMIKACPKFTLANTAESLSPGHNDPIFFIFFIDLENGTLPATVIYFCRKEIQFTIAPSALPPASLLFSRSVPGMSSDRFPVL